MSGQKSGFSRWRRLITSLNQPIGRITWIGDAFGKQVCRMHPQCSNQIGQYGIVMPPIVRYLLAPAYAVFCFPSEPIIPEGPEYGKNISFWGQNFARERVRLSTLRQEDWVVKAWILNYHQDTNFDVVEIGQNIRWRSKHNFMTER